MKKHIISFLFLFMAGFSILSFNSCSEDDGPINEASFIVNTYKGIAIGNSQHFSNMPSTSTDAIIVESTSEDYSSFSVTFKSEFWGNATFENVKVIREEEGYRFEDTEGVFSMPNRTPNATEVTYKEYPATLSNSTIILLGNVFNFTIDVNLGEHAGIYTINLTNANVN
ncbi:MAG: hypothetical protein J5486_08600 [Bacteroidaceae bacterium]|nr:hypothetical protein [Bacteroidaceae bacterium]